MQKSITAMAKKKSHNTNRFRKRNAKIRVGDKWMPIKQYLEGIASELPYMEAVNEVTGKSVMIDHYQGLKKQWQAHGEAGIKGYIVQAKRHIKIHNQDALRQRQEQLNAQLSMVNSKQAKDNTGLWMRTKLSGQLWLRSVRLWTKRLWLNLTGKVTV